MTSKSIGLYVHIPFCKRRCNYCDFCSFAEGEGVPREKYIEALIADIESYGGREVSLDTVFFGGGTPSLLSPSELSKIVNSIRKTFEIDEGCEFTLEANPATLNREKLISYMENGVNRISLGLQSIHENELKILGRIHSYDDFLKTFRLCRECGITNINVDLMYSFPEQTEESLRKTLNTITELSPEHISLYGLILEEGTPLYERRLVLAFPDEDKELSMYRLAANLLRSRGYLHYEISNYSKEGFRSKHNLKYWRDEEYIGVGLSAYSYFGGERYGRTRDISEYLKAPTDRAYCERITPSDEREEYVMLALRLSEGLSLDGYRRRFNEDFEVGREEKLSEYERLGLLKIKDGCISLTEEGFYVSNTIISSLI